jgi:hypothetical protein
MLPCFCGETPAAGVCQVQPAVARVQLLCAGLYVWLVRHSTVSRCFAAVGTSSVASLPCSNGCVLLWGYATSCVQKKRMSSWQDLPVRVISVRAQCLMLR